MSKSKLVIVSNRLPVSVVEKDDGSSELQSSSGGLVSGLREVHNQTESVWLGHLGNLCQEGSINDFMKEHRLVDVPIKPEIYDSYYNGYSNDTLWPLFHNFLASMGVSDNHWPAYVEANEAFADKIQEIVNPGDRVWIHDYQLMLLPNLLRMRQLDLKISYFHHIPFPSSEIFRTIPRRKQLIQGLLGADYIGFHTYDYARHFIQSVKRLAGAKTRIYEIIHEDRPIKVAAHPLGVDFKAFDQERPLRQISPEYLKDKSNITFLGIDRLDYTKGLPERLQSFERFLQLYPKYRGKAKLIQVCVPSRQDIGSYNQIRSSVERLVGKINGEFSSPDYIPIEYIFRSIPPEEVIDLYQQADVMVVTPLRDGLNLVCKEYVAARTDGDGCLILSEFAGAAAEMGEALQVNPYDIDTVARTFNKALEMPKAERARRMKTLRKRMAENDNIAWGINYMEMWDHHSQEGLVNTKYLSYNQQLRLLAQIKSSDRVFLFLDYDGTLAPIKDRPELAIPDKQLDDVMATLNKFPNLITSIVTGRPQEFCDMYLTGYNTHIIAEHGAFMKLSLQPNWEQLITVSAEDSQSLQIEIMELLETYTCSVPKSHIETKETCIVWHYRESDQGFAQEQAQVLGETLEQMLNKTSWSVYHGKKSVEIRQSLAHKGFGVEKILELLQWQAGLDSLITVGDDTTDEDMHRVQTDYNQSIHIGSENAYSRYYLESPEKLYDFLQRIVVNPGDEVEL